MQNEPRATGVPDPNRLEGWKEIAEYLDVTVRTAQQWEKRLRLPIHRKGRSPKPRVHAFEHNLDAWLNDRPRPQARRAVVLVLGALLVTLAVGAVLFKVGGRSCFPYRAEIRDRVLYVFDSSEELCWPKRFQRLASQQYEKDESPDLRTIADQVIDIVDLDQDGRMEVVFTEIPISNGASDSLHCFDQGGREKWTFSAWTDRDWKGNPVTSLFRVDFVTNLRVHDDRIVAAIAQHFDAPLSDVVFLSPEGERLGEYVHPGRVVDFAAYDIDQDGIEELFLAGVNNPEGLGRPFLTALQVPLGKPSDSLVSKGSEARGARELFYLVFPRPDVFDVASVMTQVFDLEVFDDRVTAAVGKYGISHVLYEFDAALRTVKSRPAHDLLAIHKDLENRGLLDHPTSNRERLTWGQVIVADTAFDTSDADILASMSAFLPSVP